MEFFETADARHHLGKSFVPVGAAPAVSKLNYENPTASSELPKFVDFPGE